MKKLLLLLLLLTSTSMYSQNEEIIPAECDSVDLDEEFFDAFSDMDLGGDDFDFDFDDSDSGEEFDDGSSDDGSGDDESEEEDVGEEEEDEDESSGSKTKSSKESIKEAKSKKEESTTIEAKADLTTFTIGNKNNYLFNSGMSQTSGDGLISKNGGLMSNLTQKQYSVSGGISEKMVNENGKVDGSVNYGVNLSTNFTNSSSLSFGAGIMKSFNEYGGGGIKLNARINSSTRQSISVSYLIMYAIPYSYSKQLNFNLETALSNSAVSYTMADDLNPSIVSYASKIVALYGISSNYKITKKFKVNFAYRTMKIQAAKVNFYMIGSKFDF